MMSGHENSRDNRWGGGGRCSPPPSRFRAQVRHLTTFQIQICQPTHQPDDAETLLPGRSSQENRITDRDWEMRSLTKRGLGSTERAVNGLIFGSRLYLSRLDRPLAAGRSNGGAFDSQLSLVGSSGNASGLVWVSLGSRD